MPPAYAASRLGSPKKLNKLLIEPLQAASLRSDRDVMSSSLQTCKDKINQEGNTQAWTLHLSRKNKPTTSLLIAHAEKHEGNDNTRPSKQPPRSLFIQKVGIKLAPHRVEHGEKKR